MDGWIFILISPNAGFCQHKIKTNCILFNLLEALLPDQSIKCHYNREGYIHIGTRSRSLQKP